MNDPTLYTVVAYLVALSVASERLVEIIKGLVPVLNEPKKDAKQEGRRRAALQFLAVMSGIFTAFLARTAAVGVLPGEWDNPPGILAMGLLASGGSGFWNAILTYVARVKDIKKLQAQGESSGTPTG